MKKAFFVSILSAVVALSGFQSVFANENSKADSGDEVVVTAENPNTGETASTVVQTGNTEGNVAEKAEEDAPSLLPGDFFYFVKTMIENVRLAVTADDYKEAKLLAQYAAERISEANALMAEGKTEEAAEVLQKAIATQKDAEDEAGTDSASKTEVNGNTDTEVGTEADEQVTVEDKDVTDADEPELESKLAHNIDALLAALSHVENPQAKASLKKNIQKTFAKLDKKIDKLEKKANRDEEEAKAKVKENGDVAVKTNVDTDTKVQVEEVKAPKEVDVKEAVQGIVKPAKEKVKQEHQKAKEVKKQVNQVKKVAKEQAKQAKKKGQEVAKQVKENHKNHNNGK